MKTGILTASIVAATVCAPGAGAAVVYTDSAAFDSALERVHIEDFESFSAGGGVFAVGFDGAVTADASFSSVKANEIVVGGVDPDGSGLAWSLKGGVTRLTLSGLGVNAFGVHFINRGPVIFELRLIGATTETALVSGGNSGFLGLIGEETVSAVEIAWTNANGKAASFDGVRVGWLTPAMVAIPTPRSITLGLAGLAVFAWPRRRA